MSEDPGGAIRPDIAPRSLRKGDVPEPVARRYFTDARGGRGLGFYVDARITAPAFRDEGRRLVAARNDPNVARDLARIARHRGWSIVVVQGDPNFRREAWLAARTLGLEVRGYRPTERDVQDLARATAAQERRNRSETSPTSRKDPPAIDRRPNAPRAHSILQVVERVVHARVKTPEAQDRMLSRARERLERGLERGDLPPPSRAAPLVEPPHRRERVRGA